MRQDKIAKKGDVLKEHTLKPIGSVVAVQREDGRPLKHSTVMDHSDIDHHRRSYKLQITKTGGMVKRSTRNMKVTPIFVEQYLRDQMSNQSGPYICRNYLYKHFKQNTSHTRIGMPDHETIHVERAKNTETVVHKARVHQI